MLAIDKEPSEHSRRSEWLLRSTLSHTHMLTHGDASPKSSQPRPTMHS